MKSFNRVKVYHDILAYELRSVAMGQHWDKYTQAIRQSCLGNQYMNLSTSQSKKYFAVHWIFSDIAPEQGTRPLDVEGVLHYCIESYYGAALARRYREKILARISIEEMTAYLAEIDKELAQ